MKKSAVFILILLANANVFGCGYDPFEGGIRFCFFNGFLSDYKQYRSFNYTESYWYEDPPMTYSDADFNYQNSNLWVKYCQGKVGVESAFEAIYNLKPSEIRPQSSNALIRYLYQRRDYEALNYLLFAKHSEIFNAYFDDPWERSESAVSPLRKDRIDVALEKSAKAKSGEIKSRYLFLALRMAYYNGNSQMVCQLFDRHLAKLENKNILYYWSLYFRTLAEKDPVLKRYFASIVFANAPDKRYRIAMGFEDEAMKNATLKLAKNNLERAHILEMSTVLKTDHALENLREIYANNPQSEALGFLVMREMNKIEDWILTPYYTYFNSSIVGDYYYQPSEEQNTQTILARSENDRKYAGEMLKFINSIKVNIAGNPDLFESAKIYLLFLTREYSGCLDKIRTIEKNHPKNDSLLVQLQPIKAMALVANQQKGKAGIPEAAQKILMGGDARQNPKLIFAIGRELENLGNTTDAALLYSKVDHEMVWTSKKEIPYYQDYYQDYYGYVDGAYSTKQLSELISSVQNNKATDVFSEWKFAKVKTELPGLYNLLGKKHIRLNQLQLALASFTKYDELTNNEDRLNENPFYDIPFTPKFIARRDSIVLTKSGILRKLVQFMSKGNSGKINDKAYYNFLVATCFLNMNQHGNAYTFRRNNWSSSELEANLPDEKEFHGNILARQYYLLAMRQSKNKDFKFLCLRMAGRCEKLRLNYEYDRIPYNEEKPEIDAYLAANNRYYKNLRARNGSQFEALSNCALFGEYFKNR